MGIRFQCRSCEKHLNIKSTQAGQKGICPHCGQTIVIPQASNTPTSIAKKKRGEGFPYDSKVHSSGPPSVSIQLPAANDSSIVNESHSRPPIAHRLTNSLPTGADDQGEDFTLGRPTPPDSFGKVDPISQSPDRVWYFRSRSLGERGPLKPNVMRKHVDEGDVTVGCVVWRDDWEDWVPAESAFPELAQLAISQKQKARLDRAMRESNYKIPDELLRAKPPGKLWFFILLTIFAVSMIAFLVFIAIKLA